MSRNLSRWLASGMALILSFAVGLQPLAAAEYHIGSEEPDDGTHYANLEALYVAHPTLNNDTVIMYGDDNSLTQHTGTQPAFAITGTVNLRADAEGKSITINGQNIADRLFYITGTLNITNDFTFENFDSVHNGTMTAVRGGLLNADGVTFSKGGPIVVTESGDVATGTDLHSNVYLQGAAFDSNTANSSSNNAILSLTNIASSNPSDVYSVDLSNTEFKNNTANRLVYVFTDEDTYQTAPEIKIQLGAIEAGTESTLGDKGKQNVGIYLGGNISAGSGASYTLDINGAGNYVQNQAIRTDNGNYSLTVNKNDSGTWYVAEGITNEFHAQGMAMVNVNGGVIEAGKSSAFELHGTNANLNMSGGTLNMGESSIFELHGTNANLNMSGGTLNMGESSTFDVQGSIVGTNNANIGSNSKVTMGRGSQLIFTNNDNVGLHATTRLYGDNEIRADNLSITSAKFVIDANTLDYAYGDGINSQPVLTINAFSITTSSVDKTIFNFLNVKGDIKHQEIIRNNGSYKFTTADADNCVVWLDDVLVLDTVRTKAWISNDSGDGQSLYLDIELTNKILRWTGTENNNWDVQKAVNWQYEEQESSPGAGDQYRSTMFFSNDAIVFDDFRQSNFTINVASDVYISQQTGYLTDIVTKEQHWVTEYGMRVSGTANWTFNGGSISDNYVLTEGVKRGRDYLAALIFEGSGTLTLNNDAANNYHDGTVISGGGTIIAGRADSLGNASFVGETTTDGAIERLVQQSGYGIEFLGGETGGGTIHFNTGSIIDPDDPNRNIIFDQRIFIDDETSGTLSITDGQTLIITADAKYQGYSLSDKNGGAVHVGKNADFTAPGTALSSFHFEGNSSSESGGAIWADQGSNLNIANNTFANNLAANDGGAIFSTQSNISGNKTTFSNNTAGYSGGAVFVEGISDLPPPTLSFQGATFQGNEAGQDGGAIYLDDTINNAVLNLNQQSGSGKTIFRNNTTGSADSKGGAVYAGGTDIKINARGAVFEFNGATEENRLGSKGGAIYLGNFGILAAPNAVFQGNQVNSFGSQNDGGQGGAIYTGYGAALTLTGTTFGYRLNGAEDADDNLPPIIGNSAVSQGGAIYTVGDATIPEGLGLGTLDITGATFSANGYTVEQYLAGEYTGNAPYVTYDETDYIYVRQTKEGGAIYAGLTAITGNGAAFSQNAADERGGALFIRDQLDGKADAQAAAEIVLTNGQFDRNVAGQDGGAIYLDVTATDAAGLSNEVLNIGGTKFLTNAAEQDGGAIYAKAYTTINAKSVGTGNNVQQAVFDAYTGDPGFIDVEGIAGVPIGNVAGRSGGAIYLDGEVNGKATSQLNIDGALFRLNQAVTGDGGAVYLRYTDAEILGTQFITNTANTIAGGGGAIFFESEAGKSLNVETSSFIGNQAAYGGAVYAQTPTIILARNTTINKNEATIDGGAFYFNADGSQLDISMDGSKAAISNNIAQGSGGAAYLQNSSRIVADGTKFYNNEAGEGGGAIRIGQKAEIMVGGAHFDGNIAHNGNGGAILIDDPRNVADVLNVLNADNARFTTNSSTAGSGGAVYAPNTKISVVSTVFDRNTAGQNGGAVYAANSDLDAKNAGFIDNVAGGKGGAVYFLTTNGQERNIYLGTWDNAISRFSGNKSGTVSNSIYFDAVGAVTNVKLDVSTGQNGHLDMLDPMIVDKDNQNLELKVVKTGTGTWSLGGINDFTKTAVGTTFDINAGTFTLQNDGKLLLTNSDGEDYFKLASGATFTTTEPIRPQAIHRLETTNLNFAAGTGMRLNVSLDLAVGNDYTIASSLSGIGNLTKLDDNVLHFRGNTVDFKGDVTVKAGTLSIEKDPNVFNSGHFTTTGRVDMAPNTDLWLIADPANPTLVAKSANIDQVNLHVGGISGQYDDKFILIHTTDGIEGDFKTVNGDANILQVTDYLTYDLGFLNDHKDYGGNIGLRWYSKDDTLKAWGKFTVDKYFNVAQDLHDNNANLYPANPGDPSYDPSWTTRWDGKSLDKFGSATLELSGTNTYSGKTTVHKGELLLTNKQGTGLGNAAVEVQQNAKLGLNFDGKYAKTITGQGQVVQYGGTVELTGTNIYSGGTVLKDGVMEFTSGKNLGTGLITFDGGTLRNKAETALTQPIVVADGKNAKFDTPDFSDTLKTSLAVNSSISGKGGLEKTGDGILALNGHNTFTQAAYVNNGGLRIDGSVTSDVRVQSFAAVSGTGNIGGDLFVAKNGYFDWYFTPNQAESKPLNVGGSIYLAEGAVFRPRTESTDFSQPIVGWTVLNYGGIRGGEFADIDDRYNAFYHFELDYSVPNEIRVNGELLSRPNPLNDIVTAGLYVANRKLSRTPFEQLMRETVYRKSAATADRSVRGQAIAPTRSAWFSPLARANRFGSAFVGGDYDFQAYGMQTGTTLWSNGNSSVGFMIGYERGLLRNSIDWIRSHDYQLGLYFGHIYNDGYEFRGFVGGGFQTFTASRDDSSYAYKTKFDGSSFEMNGEFAKLFAGQNGTLLRPYIAADLEYAGQTAAQENRIGNAFRDYGRADLSQCYFRFGADVQKRLQFSDLNAGMSFSEMIFGQTHARVPVFYPTRGAGTTSQGARLGRGIFTLKTGWNWYFNRNRTSSLSIDYFADIYTDRAGDPAQHTGNLSLQVRF